jgi:predicted DNA-binding protein (UPF0251 family)
MKKRVKQIKPPADPVKGKYISPVYFVLYERVLALAEQTGLTQKKAMMKLGMSQTSFYRVKRHLKDGKSKW